MDHARETQWVYSASRGDRAALEALVRTHLSQAYRFAYGIVHNREDAEDAVQEAFVKAWKHLGTFDVEKPFAPWLLQIVKRTALDALKKKAAVPFSATGWDWLDRNIGDATQQLEEVGERVLWGDRLTVAMREVPGTAVAVVRAHDVEGQTFDAIARERGEPLNTVKSRYRRAIVRLRRALRRD